MNDEIRDVVAQWLAKADVDWATVEILSNHPVPPASAICFHCQQYIEKLLKAFLTVHQIEAPRTHDLRRLIELAVPNLPDLGALTDRSDALERIAGRCILGEDAAQGGRLNKTVCSHLQSALSVHAVDIRYPDNWRTISKLELQQMFDLTDDFARILLPVLKEYRK